MKNNCVLVVLIVSSLLSVSIIVCCRMYTNSVIKKANSEVKVKQIEEESRNKRHQKLWDFIDGIVNLREE